MKLRYIISTQNNPYWNIAVENYLLSLPEGDTITMYLWKNRRTVVIGMNQNPFSECNVETLEKEGGYLMRRKTGGGAVYHDDGNINFSFIVPKEHYDVQKQFSVLQKAMERYGLRAEVSGRNDVLVDVGEEFEDGSVRMRKFSGNAFSKGKYNDLHHGTILIDGNMEDMQRYLKPKEAKLRKHGVESVRSRVVNLSKLNGEINSVDIAPHLKAAFEEVYGETAEEMPFEEIIKQEGVRELYEMFASEEWKYGKWRNFRSQMSAQFEWGGVDICIESDEVSGKITEVQIASDAIDLRPIEKAKELIEGASITEKPKHQEGQMVEDILGLIYN